MSYDHFNNTINLKCDVIMTSCRSHDHHTTIRESVTFRGRSSSNPESLVHQVAAKNQTGLAVLTSSGAQCQSLSTSVPSDSSTADRILEHQGGEDFILLLLL